MDDSIRCPICEEEFDGALSERICKNCGMNISIGKPYYAVLERGRHWTFCSAKCVETYVKLGKFLLDVGR